MRQKRTERNAENYTEKAAEIFKANTYGGSKFGTSATVRKMPITVSRRGIKLEWDRREDEYPSTVSLRMTDGNWVKYRLAVDQPGFMEAVRGVGTTEGYQAEGIP